MPKHLNMSCFLVVVYKVKLKDSPTVSSIVDYFKLNSDKNAKKIELIIWDNSPSPDCEGLSWLKKSIQINVRYIHTPQNTALSVIYNKVAAGLDDNDYLTLLDQDSQLPGDFFSSLTAAQSEKWPLILPKVYCGNKMVSPGTRFYAKGRLLKSVSAGLISSRNLLAINSGTSAKGSVFKKIPYDERLSFYGTDTYFMKQYERHYKEAYLMDVSLHHSLAESDPNIDDSRKREISLAKRDSSRIVFSDSFFERLFLVFYEAYLKVRDVIRR